MDLMIYWQNVEQLSKNIIKLLQILITVDNSVAHKIYWGKNVHTVKGLVKKNIS